MNNIVSIVLSMLSVLWGASLSACGSPAATASRATAEMRDALEPPLGTGLAAEVSAVWEPVFLELARMKDAGERRDFGSYHAALLSLRTTYSAAIDGTIGALDSAPDQSWRRRLLTAATGSDPNRDAEQAGKALRELFPSGGGEESDETKAWFRGHLISNPRETGEIMRAAVDMQYDGARLSGYFMGALGGEALKAANEAYEGFTEPRSPAE